MSLITTLAGTLDLVTEVRATPPTDTQMTIMGVLGTTLAASSPSVVTTINTGFQGPPGPAGPSGAGFDFTQASESDTWTIAHNLGYRPAVQLFDQGGALFNGDVSHLNNNVVIVNLTAPMTGFARLN